MCIMKRISIICLVIQILMSFPGCAPIFPSAPQTPAPPNDCAENNEVPKVIANMWGVENFGG